MNNSVPVLR